MKKLILTCATILFTTIITFAQDTDENTAELSIQGVLRNANGTAVENGQYDIIFRLWDAPTNGTKIWEEEKTQVDVEGGIYSVVLGDGATELTADFTKKYYLGVAVEGGTELIPRAALTSSPYALSLIGDDNIFPNSGNVGVGSSAPQHKFTVQRKEAILGLEADSNAVNTATITTIAEGMQFDAGGTDNVFQFEGGEMNIEGNNKALLSLSKSGAAASIGYDETNGNNLILSNPNGHTNINSIGTSLSLTDSIANLNGYTSVNHNAEAFRLNGTDHSYLAFYPFGESAGRKGYFGYTTPNNPDLIISNEASSGDLNLHADGGIVKVNDHLQVGGETVPFYVGTYFFANGGNHNHSYPANQTIHYSFRVIGGRSLFESEINVISDKRVKKDFKLSKGNEDLSLLKKIEVTDYRYIDEMQYGKELKKGVLAQQIKEIYPQAVSQAANFIPSIYTFPTKITKDNEAHTFTFEKAHQLKKGDLLKFIVGKNVVKTTVSEIIDENSFSILNWKEGTNTEEIFLYGQQVNDRLAVDYDEIFTLNISATQELARKVEALEKENAQLKSNQSKTNDILKSLSAKVESLQQNLEMTGQK